MNKYAIISLIILSIGGFFVYKEFIKPNSNSKEKSIDIIFTNGKHADRNFISTLDESFLSAWADSVLKKQLTFSHAGKTYNTQGGKSIK